MSFLHQRDDLCEQFCKLLVTLATVPEHPLSILQLLVFWEVKEHLDQVPINDTVQNATIGSL